MTKWRRMKALCETATPGPWTTEPFRGEFYYGCHEAVQIVGPVNCCVNLCVHGDLGTCKDGCDTAVGSANAEFIITARTALPEAIAWIDRAVTVLREALDPAGDPHWGCVADQLVREVTG